MLECLFIPSHIFEAIEVNWHVRIYH